MYLTIGGENRLTPQRVQADRRQHRNAAGGFTFSVDDWDRLDRFLILGTQGGTFYVGQNRLTQENTENIEAMIAADGPRVVTRVVEISDAGRAAKQDYGLYVLALAAASDNSFARAAAYAAIPMVCRTASTLFQFLSYIRGRRGWSRGLREAVASWYYTHAEEGDLAYQMTKYRNRNGFTHRDALRLAHVRPEDDQQAELFAWACGKQGALTVMDTRGPVFALGLLETNDEVKERAEFIHYFGLVREHLPAEWLNDPEVQRALLLKTPLTALIRNLGNFTASGMLSGGSAEAKHTARLLGDQETLNKARVHPMAIFLARAIYAQGHGDKGKLIWAPVTQITRALEDAFPLAFGNVTPIGGRVLVGIDVSGSMGSQVLGYPVSARDAAAAMATIHAHTEQNVDFMGFDTSAHPFEVASDVTMAQMAEICSKWHGATDLAVPVRYAIQHGEVYDTIIIYTDNETWAGRGHGHEVLAAYRDRVNSNVRVVIASLVATGSTVGDPKDPKTLQAVGLDAGLPNVIAEFCRK